ncbi:MAG: RidA family protein [Rhodobacter sp.]|nr:RidA family protein [Rhodobacter sp.]
MSAIRMTTGGSRPVAAFGRAVGADGRALSADPATPDAPPPGGIAARTRRVMGNRAVVLNGIGPDRPDVMHCRCCLSGSARSSGAFDKICQGCFLPGRRPARTMIGATAQTPVAPVGADCIACHPAAGAAA